MAVDEESQELREAVKRLEATVASLEARLAQLEASGVPPSVSSPPPGVAPETVPPPARQDLEAHLGTYWLSRVGIVALIIGIAYLITYHFGELGKVARVAAGYLLSAGLAAFGLWLARRHTLFGRIVFGGGLALAYFVTFALHFIPSVRVIDSEALTLVLLALHVVGIVAIAQRMHSETVAGIALFLGLHTGMLSDITAFTLMSTSLLAAGALFFLVKNRWVIVPLSSMVAVYSTHITWALRSPALAPGERLPLSLGFLTLYFLLFSVALLSRPRELPAPACLAFAGINWAGLLLLGSYEVSTDIEERLFTFLVVVALVHAVGAVVARIQRAPPVLFHAYVCLCAVTLALAMPVKFEGSTLVEAWALTGVVAGVGSRGVASPVLRWVGLAILGVALVACDLFTPGRVLPLAVLFVAFILVERVDSLRVPGWPETTGLDGSALKAACAGGAGLALLGLVGGQMPKGLITLGWGVAASGLFIVGFAVRERWYRFAGLGVLALALGRLLVVDLARLPADQRILTFILLGVMLLLISYVYTRLRDRRG